MELINDDLMMLKLNVVHKLRKWLQRDKRGYKSQLHHRIGVGLTEADFDWCIKMLENMGYCTVTEGRKHGTIVTLKEQPQ